MSIRILIVEDEDSLRETLAANLELEDFEVDEAVEGAEALRKLAAGDYDVVISDIRMPGLGGVELYEELRRRGDLTPVVLMTAFTSEDRLDVAVGSGVFAVLSKPFDIDHVVRVLARASSCPRVLVVDDMTEEAESLVNVLRAAHVEAEHATSVAEAIARVEGRHIDVCLTDLVMPGEGGVELAQQLPRIAGVTVIVFSGKHVPDLMRRAAALGAHACLEKPIAPMTVVKAVAKARAAET